MTEFASPFALHSRRPLRIRAIGVAAAAIAGTFSLLFPTSAAETGFRIPDWPLARAGRLEATSPGQANPNAASEGYSPAGTIPSAGAAIARPPQRSAENGGKFELVRDDPSPADAESGDAAAAETGVRALPPLDPNPQSPPPGIERVGGGELLPSNRDRLSRGAGILERQSEIGEGILLLERQLRHADMVRKFMAIMGPEAPVEVSPGRFEDFSQIPEGRRLAAELREQELESELRELELLASVNMARRLLRESELDLGMALSASAGQPNAGATAPSVAPVKIPPQFSLRSVYGSADRLAAIVAADGRRLEVLQGDALPGGGTVLSIGEDEIAIEIDGETSVLGLSGR